VSNQRENDWAEPTWYAESTAPKPLDVVWCHFPFEDVEEHKDRPTLVRDVLYDEGNRKGQVWLDVTYGTSRIDKPLSPGSFSIVPYSELAQIGLHKNTRFELFKTALLPWSLEHFPNCPGKNTPILGHLTGRQKIRLQEFQKRIDQAMAAMKKSEGW